jgi:hypothetical protein
MDNSREHALPSYEKEGIPSYEETTPSYEASVGAPKPHVLSAGMNVTLDPTGMFIKQLPSSDAPPVYSLSMSLLHVHTRSSIHVKRSETKGGETSSLAVYAIGEHFMSPLHTRKRMMQNITVARSHGLLATVGVREIVWDFSVHVPLKKGEGMDGLKSGGSIGPTDPVYLLGVGNGPGTVQKHILVFYSGKWEQEDGELIAIEREGGVECEGMPVLSVIKDLDPEMADFLVSAWCVTMWGEVGKRARRLSKSGGGKLNIGKLSIGRFSLG